MIFIEETFSLTVVFKKDFYAKNLNYIKNYKYDIIKNIYITNTIKNIKIYIKNLAKFYVVS